MYARSGYTEQWNIKPSRPRPLLVVMWEGWGARWGRGRGAKCERLASAPVSWVTWAGSPLAPCWCQGARSTCHAMVHWYYASRPSGPLHERVYKRGRGGVAVSLQLWTPQWVVIIFTMYKLLVGDPVSASLSLVTMFTCAGRRLCRCQRVCWGRGRCRSAGLCPRPLQRLPQLAR